MNGVSLCVCPRGGGACVRPIGCLVCPGDTVPFFIIGSNCADVLKCTWLVCVHLYFYPGISFSTDEKT